MNTNTNLGPRQTRNAIRDAVAVSTRAQIVEQYLRTGNGYAVADTDAKAVEQLNALIEEATTLRDALAKAAARGAKA